MSFYELERPVAHVPATRPLDRLRALFAGLGARLTGMGDSFAYARMMSVMYDMDDATLARIGITRADIPAHVDRCLNRRKG